MDARKVARGLGWFSVGLGLAEAIAPGRIVRSLGLDSDNQGTVQAFGLRELLSGAAILMSGGRGPLWIWARVAGDLMDMGLLRRAQPVGRQRRTNRGLATAAVLGAAALDLATAQRLSKQAGARRRRVARARALHQRGVF
jgi:hypothetical protein